MSRLRSIKREEDKIVIYRSHFTLIYYVYVYVYILWNVDYFLSCTPNTQEEVYGGVVSLYFLRLC